MSELEKQLSELEQEELSIVSKLDDLRRRKVAIRAKMQELQIEQINQLYGVSISIGQRRIATQAMYDQIADNNHGVCFLPVGGVFEIYAVGKGRVYSHYGENCRGYVCSVTTPLVVGTELAS